MVIYQCSVYENFSAVRVFPNVFLRVFFSYGHISRDRTIVFSLEPYLKMYLDYLFEDQKYI
jgi:hypothetical protein